MIIPLDSSLMIMPFIATSEIFNRKLRYFSTTVTSCWGGGGGGDISGPAQVSFKQIGSQRGRSHSARDMIPMDDVNDCLSTESACAAPKRMAALRRFMFLFCGRRKIGGGHNRLLRDESYELYLIKQRGSVPCVAFCFLLLLMMFFFNCQTFRLLTRRFSLESLWLLTFGSAFRI